ncbi:MAG: hypothetical protein DRH11_16730 [Deltaproteobacteria bacterium]|nr:MAG: hypothetical protein DRG63_07265 [Deltaproteobacteria bacterium]RLB28855.1 MAG: hypothetical protein DRH11_16730 [Deltaproteobacteria bacterium]
MVDIIRKYAPCVIGMVLIISCLALAACGIPVVKPTEANFKAPVITLQSIEVPQYDGYYYYSKKIKPTKGQAGDHGAFLPLSFVFKIENPNPYPIVLEEVKFTVAFDKDFELVTFNSQDEMGIPFGKIKGYFSPKVIEPFSNTYRATTMITTRSALLSLLVTGGYKLKARGWSPWQALERWWRGVPDYSVPVTVKEGTFTFKADGVEKVIPFEATFP